MVSQEGVSDRLSKSGIEFIDPDIGLDILEHLMTTAVPQVGVLPGKGWITPQVDFFADLLLDNLGTSKGGIQETHSKEAEPSSACQHRGIMAQLLQIAEDVDPAQQPDAQSLQTTIRAAQLERLLNHLRQEVATVLGIPAADLTDSQAGFTDLGIDSLTAVELRNRLQTSLEQPLPATLIYDYPTLATLSIHLLERLVPASELLAGNSSQISSSVDREDAVFEADQSLDNLSESELEALLLEELEKLED